MDKILSRIFVVQKVRCQRSILLVFRRSIKSFRLRVRLGGFFRWNSTWGSDSGLGLRLLLRALGGRLWLGLAASSGLASGGFRASGLASDGLGLWSSDNRLWSYEPYLRIMFTAQHLWARIYCCRRPRPPQKKSIFFICLFLWGSKKIDNNKK